MEGVPASILPSAQNVKVKFLSIIRCVSTVNYCLPTRGVRGLAPGLVG